MPDLPADSSPEHVIRVNDVDLCIQTFGDPGDPAILLIGGVACSMLFWDEEFCRALASGSRFVIRYDLRDTGRSVTYAAGAATYGMRDLAEDAVALLDELDSQPAHIVGMSMGGVIGQLLAVEHADRVATLTLVSTTPGDCPGFPTLPSMPANVSAEFAQLPEPDWSDRAALVELLVTQERLLAARTRPFDEAETRRRIGADVDRAIDFQSTTNHYSLDGGEPIRSRLGEITAPTLVLHGDEDPVFPIEHARALADEVPGARLVVLGQVGHEFPAHAWTQAAPKILAHTADSRV